MFAHLLRAPESESKRPRNTVHFVCEQLESRSVPAADFTVNTSADTPDVVGDNKAEDATGMVSLRAVLDYVNENVAGRKRTGDWNTSKYEIAFAVQGNMVTLTSDLPNLTSNFLFTGGGVTVERDVAQPARFRLFQVVADTESRFSDMTFRGGDAVLSGGAINNLGKLTVDGCTFHDNKAGWNGGAISSGETATNLTIRNCSFWFNSAVRLGGAIGAADKTELVISATDIFSNSVTGTVIDPGYGGGVFIGTDKATVAPRITNNSRIFGNWAASDGGGIYVSGTNFAMTDGEIHGNTSANGYGGGIYVDADDKAKTTTLTNVKLTNNSAGKKGGGAYARGGTMNLNLSLFTGNTAALGLPGAGYNKTDAAATLTLPPNPPPGSQELTGED